MSSWSISELAREFGTTLRTIRYYEDLGLIAPERHGVRRVYRPRDRVRLRLVLRGKRLGMSLDEIATIIDLYDRPTGEAGQLEFLLTAIARHRASLERQRDDLDHLLGEFAELEAACRDDLDRLGQSSD